MAGDRDRRLDLPAGGILDGPGSLDAGLGSDRHPSGGLNDAGVIGLTIDGKSFPARANRR